MREGLQEEVEQQNQVGLLVESNQRTVTRHLQEVRRLLNLSPGTYRFPDRESNSKNDGTNGNDDARGYGNGRYGEELFFAGIDRIAAEQKLTTLETHLAEEIPAALIPIITNVPPDLTLRDTGRLRWEIRERSDAAWIRFRADTEGFTVSSVLGEEIHTETVSELTTVVSRWIRQVDQRVAAFATAREQIDELLNSSEILDSLTAQSLVVGPRQENDGTVVYSFITDLTGDTAFTASVSRTPPTFSVDGKLHRLL